MTSTTPPSTDASLRSLTPSGLRSELAKALESKRQRRERDRLAQYDPYAKQREFHAAGLEARERLLMAGNQLGKTYCGAAEAAIHLTGLYPAWWPGRRFARPVRAWAGSKTGEVTRDGVQRLLVGNQRRPPMPSPNCPAPTRRCLSLCVMLGLLPLAACASPNRAPLILALPVAESLRQPCARPGDVEAVRNVGDLAAFSVRQEAALAVCDARREALVQIVDAHNALAARP